MVSLSVDIAQFADESLVIEHGKTISVFSFMLNMMKHTAVSFLLITGNAEADVANRTDNFVKLRDDATYASAVEAARKSKCFRINGDTKLVVNHYRNESFSLIYYAISPMDCQFVLSKVVNRSDFDVMGKTLAKGPNNELMRVRDGYYVDIRTALVEAKQMNAGIR